jgi:hypothetical protein
MSTCFCRSSFTRLCHSPVRISFRSRVHRPLSFTCSQFLCSSPVTESTSFAGPPFVHGSTHLCRSSFPATSVLHRFSVPLSIPGPHLLSLTGTWTCVVHRFPLSPSYIGSHFPCCSSVPRGCTVCVYGGAVCTDLVNQLQYVAISDVIFLLLPPTWVALLYVRAA